MSVANALTPGARIDVCVCTFRRPSLRDTLGSLARQQVPVRIIVADNDETPSAAATVEDARAEFGLDVVYIHAPARNISIARNACLDAVESQYVAFIDDDEVAPSTWLAALLRQIETDRLDVVFGPVRALYPNGAPAWAVSGNFHSFGPVVRADGEIDTGYSSNVLIRHAVIGALRFDPALGRTGGEDTVFFAQMHERGARLGFAPDAEVQEPTASERTKLGWLLRRSFRSGQSHARVLAMRGRARLAIGVPALAKAAYCMFAALLSMWSPVGVRRNLIRGALHVGAVAKALGAGELVLYGKQSAEPGANGIAQQ